MIINDTRNRFQKGKIEAKVRFNELKWKSKEVLNWVKDHPREAILIVSIAMGVIGGMAKTVQKAEERHDMRTRVWDPVNGVYHHTKHEMTTKQKLEFEDRVSKGEQRGKVLEDMGVLRRW